MTIKCRAAVGVAPGEKLEIRDVEVAPPGPHDVMIRLKTAGLCHSDLSGMDGKLGQTFPLVFGLEGFGHVEQVGGAVTTFKPGDAVVPYLVPDCGVCPFCRSGRTNFCAEFPRRMANPTRIFSSGGSQLGAFMGIGSFSEVIVIPEDMAVAVNPNVPADFACCIGCGVTTGLGAATITARVDPQSTVVVIGVGGVGASVIQGARLRNAARIIAIDANPTKEPIARKFGATDFIDASSAPDATPAVRAIAPLGADYAFECVGLPELARKALELTNPAWGKVVNVGVMGRGKDLVAEPTQLAFGRTWSGSFMGGAKRRDVASFVDMFMAGDLALDGLISGRLRLDEINDGFDAMRRGESVRSIIEF